MARLAQLLGTLGYRSVLGRGYALVRDAAGQPLRSAVGVAPGARLGLEFADGTLAVEALGGPGGGETPPTVPDAPKRKAASPRAAAKPAGGKPAGGKPAGTKPAARAAKGTANQGSLF